MFKKPFIFAHCEEPITVEWLKPEVARSADAEASAVSCAVWARIIEGRAEGFAPALAAGTSRLGRWVVAGGGWLMDCIE